MLKQILLPLAVAPMVLAASWTTTNTATTTPTTFAAATTTHSAYSTALTPQQTTRVNELVDQYLRNNPKVVVDAIMAYRQAEITKFQAEVTHTIAQNKTAIFNTNNNLVLGNPRGDVTIVEFIDYRCGHCKAMAPVLKQAIQQDRNLKVVVKELPLFGGPSTFAAKAAIAAEKQSRFAKLHNFLMTTTTPLTQDSILKACKDLGINTRRLKADIASQYVTNYVETNMNLAKTLKISATPTFIISKNNGEVNQYVPGAITLAQLQATIQAVRTNTTTTTR